MRVSRLLPLVAGLAGLAAADQPLGLVDVADAKQLGVRFDASAKLTPGGMLAIYGPGTVKKHPLTKEIIVENRRLVAKAQLLRAVGEAPLPARITWVAADAKIEAGFDVVPLPAEAAPNAPPALTGAVAPVNAVAGATLTLRLPFADPDGDDVVYLWTAKGPAGAVGRFATASTGQPEIGWTAPALPGPVSVEVVARDAYGQETPATLAVTVAKADDLRGRQPRPAIRYGGEAEPALARLTRDGTGIWWGLGTAGQVVRLGTSWSLAQPVAFAETPRKAVAVAVVRGDLYVLDAGATTLRTCRGDGSQGKAFGQFVRPTDLAVAADGTIYVADQGLGGVLVLAPGGKTHGLLGRAGEGDDSFRGLTRIALAGDGTVNALDAESRQVLRFDRFHRRLTSLALPKEKPAAPVDLVNHPRGLLVLLADGRVLGFDAKGKSELVAKPLAESGLIERPGEPLALATDLTGDLYITWSEGLVSRHRADGGVAVRGAALRPSGLFAVDGLGRTVAVDGKAFALFDAEGWLLRRFGAGKVGEAIALAVVPDGSAVHILDGKKRQVVRLRLDGDPDKDAPVSFGQPGKNSGQFEAVKALAVDAAGRSYVLDDDLYRVSVFASDGRFIASFAQYGKTASDLRTPTLVAAAPDGSAVYVFDDKTSELKKWAFDPSAGKAAHVGNGGGNGEGPAQFRDPVQLACDRFGLLHVIDNSRRDVQTLDFHGANLVPLVTVKVADVGLTRCPTGAIAPDGQIWIGHEGRLVGLDW